MSIRSSPSERPQLRFHPGQAFSVPRDLRRRLKVDLARVLRSVSEGGQAR